MKLTPVKLFLAILAVLTLFFIPNDIMNPIMAIMDTVYLAVNPKNCGFKYLSMCRNGGRSNSSLGEPGSLPTVS